MAYNHRKDEKLFAMAEEALSQTRDPRLRFKLRAILSCSCHSVKDVADIMGVSRQTLWRWIKRFREEELEGLSDRPKGHRKPKLTPAQLDQVAKWIEKGTDAEGLQTSWTLAKLRDEIEKNFGVRMGITPLWRWMRKNGFPPRKTPNQPEKAGQSEVATRVIRKRDVLLLLFTVASLFSLYSVV